MALLDLSLSRTLPRTSKLVSIARNMAEVRRQREALRRLDDRALADIGVTRAEADAEASRPVWDVPAIWRWY